MIETTNRKGTMKKGQIILAALLCWGFTASGQLAPPPPMTGAGGTYQYCNARNIYPGTSPFVTYNPGTAPVPETQLLRETQEFVPGFGNKIYWWTMSPGQWVVYKDYEYMDLELRTEQDGQIKYENHSIYEYRLGLGNRIRRQVGANGVIQPWTDTGWSYGNPGELFSEWDWGSSDELTDVTPMTTRFFNKCTIRTSWKLANTFPQLMIGPAEVLLIWSGFRWSPYTFYAAATPTAFINPTFYYYPQGANFIYVSAGMKNNYRLLGTPLVDSACACPQPRM